MNRRRPVLIGLVACAACVLAGLLHGPLDSMDDRVMSLEYRVRGDRHADTNVVIVYIDQDAIKSLGWPVRRNFYALMIRALSDLRAKAIGIEAVFEEPRFEYPEYDDLLAVMTSAAGNVVLTCYFDSVAAGPGSPGGGDLLPASLFTFPGVLYDPPACARPHLPLPALQASAAGVGHVNIAGDADIDLFLGDGRLRIPAFGEELFRVACRTDRNGVAADGRKIVYRGEDASLAFSPTGDGRVRMNFPGKFRAFTAYPFLEVLRAYDALRSGRAPSIPVASLRGKIVLVGIIAEGRSQFVQTPVDAQLPAVALHAAFLDNALSDRFLVQTPWWAVLLLSAVAACCAAAAALALGGVPRFLTLAAAPVFILLTAFLLFAAGGIIFPVSGPLAAGFVAAAAGFFLRQKTVRNQVRDLEREKDVILEQLHDREAKVAMLEKELADRETERSKEHADELLSEMKKYKAEIRTLSSRAGDMDAYESGHEGAVSEAAEFEGMVFDTGGPMSEVVGFVKKIAASDAPVLILGESGTGKELVARAIHNLSPRAQGVFVAVNCGALSESLLESELFGHEKGAFTGAVKERQGRFEIADGGTIFLDEIGEVSEGFQVKLLRVLQEHEFERVGGAKTLKADVRVLAATNKDLKELVRQKKFREDLYYRLNVLSVAVPPLRKRQSDIPLLLRHFIRREDPGLKISRNVVETLQNFSWPGNIRELESAMTRGILLAKAEHRGMITIKDLSEDIAASARTAVPVEEQVLESLRDKDFSRSSITETADELGGLNRGTVAEYLRGECLKVFVESMYDLDKAVRRISLSVEPPVNTRVRKKYEDYLTNIAEAVDRTAPWDRSRAVLKPKGKNLPQKYHQYLDQVGEAFFRGIWKLPS